MRFAGTEVTEVHNLSSGAAPTTAHHTAVWIDHNEAKVFQSEPEGFETGHIKTPLQRLSRQTEGLGQYVCIGDFFCTVADALKDAEDILIVGPCSTTLDFIRHVHKHNLALEPKILGVEALAHPTDGQLIAHVRHHFHRNTELRTAA